VVPLFPRFRRTTTVPTHRAFGNDAPWTSAARLEAALQVIDAELYASRRQGSTTITTVLAPILDDLVDAKAETRATLFIDYVRLYLVAQACTRCISEGRWGLAYDWLLCSLSDLTWSHREGGAHTDAEHHGARLLRFFDDRTLVAIGDARRFVLVWLVQLTYYSWKQGALRELVTLLLEGAVSLVSVGNRTETPRRVAHPCHELAALRWWSWSYSASRVSEPRARPISCRPIARLLHQRECGNGSIEVRLHEASRQAAPMRKRCARGGHSSLPNLLREHFSTVAWATTEIEVQGAVSSPPGA
jgi:hypothetical protein